MKRKPNKPKQEPRERPGSWESAADPGGAAGGGSPGGAGAADSGTSGQSVHKSKFRQKSKQEQAAASKLRMEERGEKLERAKDKLAKQKPPKKPGPVRRIGRAAGGAAHGFVHGKIYENEQENVGIEGAHRSELVGESGLRHGKRFVQKKIRQHPAKAVQRAESKYVKATADYHFRMAAQEHPEMSGNPVSRMWRKHRLKKQYQKCAPALYDAVLFFFPGDAGKFRRGGRGRYHLPIGGRGDPGGGGGLFRHGSRTAKLPGHLYHHPQL